MYLQEHVVCYLSFVNRVIKKKKHRYHFRRSTKYCRDSCFSVQAIPLSSTHSMIFIYPKDKKINDPDGKFTGNQTKLLYTLHWIILDAASECEDNDTEKLNGKSMCSYLHSLDTIQLFVYLFAPLIHILKDSDFQSLKLEPGMCFACTVHVQESVLLPQVFSCILRGAFDWIVRRCISY